MKFIKLYLIIFICLIHSVKVDSKQNLINELKDGGNLIFIRHAYAPGSGDPAGFDINNCSTQRNLSNKGIEQAKKIGSFFTKKKISVNKIYSSEWCRCKETASVAFQNYETKNFLNSFFSEKYIKNKNLQIIDLKEFIKNWNGKQNLVFITHYVVIFEILNYGAKSGEIIITNKDFKVIDTFDIEY
jgi:phosphohistidine phosphatase SixA|tara:strand:- start:2 stop:559 length:558 start_codon:yes stop_codon:yes gene_type:complete